MPRFRVLKEMRAFIVLSQTGKYSWPVAQNNDRVARREDRSALPADMSLSAVAGRTLARPPERLCATEFGGGVAPRPTAHGRGLSRPSVNVLALQQQRDALLRPASQEEILQRLEQRVGPEGRQLLEGFWTKVKRLERQNGLSARPALLKNGASGF